MSDDFAEFEEKVNQALSGEVSNDEPEQSVSDEDQSDDEPNEQSEDEQSDDEQSGEEDQSEEEESDTADAEDDEEKPKRRRSKPASERIAELTARLREAERQLEAKNAPADDAKKAPEKPDPNAFEFGEADPDYIDKLTDWKIESREAEKTAAASANAEQTAMLDKINTGVALAEETAKAKYEDFDAKIAEAVESRGGEPLPPMLTVALGISPVGGDLIYRLATDEAASTRMERLAKGGQATSNAMAMAFGELEGEYMEDDSDSDLDMTDSMDMARMMGRMRARLKGPKAEKKVIPMTKAPEPPEQRARGGSGKFETKPDTNDFAAFERLARKAMK